MVEAFGVQLGSIAQVGTFLAVIIALIGAYVKLSDRGMTHAEVMCGQLTTEVANLRAELRACEKECGARLKHLQEEISGMRDQRNQEQVSMIRAILQSVENPDLRKQLELLEAVQGMENVRVLKATVKEHKDVKGA